jgi:acyl-CoA dehydrogenase
MSGGDLVTMLADQAGRLFGDLIDRDLLAATEAGVSPAALADAIDAFGLADALAVTADEGGLSFLDAATLFSLFGYHAVPLPIGETMLARAVLARAGIDAPEGAIALADPSMASASDAPHVLLHRQGRLRLLPAGRIGIGSISRQRRIALDFAAAPIAESEWPAALPDALTLGAMLRASQIAGAVARTLALSVEYANTRQQFGRPIGRFQAVQQLLAKLAAETAAARSAADGAWASLDAGAPGPMAAVARVRAGEAARNAAAIAHQVHGAIGVTDEHILHYFTRRLWEWRTDFGSDGHWAEQLGRAARADEAGIWHFLTCCGASRTVKELA